MPPAATTRGLNAGTQAEVRVAQAWFWDGYYVRRGVDLQHRFGSEVSTITDLDILGYTFDPALSYHKRIGEVKTGKSSSTPKPLDRALWMRGLRDLVGAESGEVTTAFHPSVGVRDLCRSLGVAVQHLDDLTAREGRLHIQDVTDQGSQGESVALIRDEVQTFVKPDPMLERAYWFLVSEVWFLEPYDALKRTLGLIRELVKTWPAESHTAAMTAARWFLAEAVSVTTLNLAIIAGDANSMDADAFKTMASARLAAGDVPIYALRSLSDRVDQYIGKLLTSVDAPADLRVNAMGAFSPMPPDYTEPLLELISRLAASAAPTASLPRQLDAVIFERLVRGRDLSPELRQRLRLSRNTDRLMRLIGAFLRGQFNIPAEVDKALTSSVAGGAPPGEPSAGQDSLF